MSGVPVIRGTNLGFGRALGGEYVYVSEDKVRNDLARNTAESGDLVFTQRGTLGQVALVPNGPFPLYVISQSQMRLRVDPSIASAEYLYYACSSSQFLKQIHDNAISTGVPHINLGILSRLSVPLPELSAQQAIAEVLGALDDKIAANTKLASTADALATTQFHKAVHGVAFSDQSFGDIAMVSGGGTPSTKVLEYWDGDTPWATPTDITPLQGPYLESTNRTISQAGLSACASLLYPVGSILMTSRATIGAFALAQRPMAVNQGFIVVQPADPALNYWVFHEMRSRVDEFVSLANGATFLELSRGNFKKFKVRLAEPGVMEEFGHSAEKLHAVARTALLENAKLTETRDALLPQLMSGKLRVKDADKVLENAGV